MNKLKTYLDFNNHSEIGKDDLFSIEEKSFQSFMLKAK